MSFNQFENQNDEVMNEINMTPLVDVMLVLLIIFIITAPVMHHAFKLELPQASSVEQQLKPETIQIAIEADGRYRWNADYISEEEMQIRMLEAAKQQPQPEIHINGDKHARYELIIQILNLAQQSSLTKIGFVTQPK